MPVAYKVLGQSAPANTSNANVYTVPASTSAVVSSIVVTNTTAISATARIFVRVGGAAAAVGNALVYDTSFLPNSTTAFTLGITLATTDIVTVQTGTANAITFQVFGSELT
jgi:hypothetical protein